MSPRNQSTHAATGPNPAIIIGAVVAVLVVAAIAVFLTAGGDDDGVDEVTSDPDALPEFGIVTVDGDPLPELGDGDDPAVGALAPSVVSERVEGQVRLEPGDADGPVMVTFLAHWCPHCQRELPLLVEMQDAGAFDDLRAVAVLTGTDPSADNYPPSAWLDDEGWDGDRLFDDEEQSAARAYGLTSYPMMVFLDADGNVVTRVSGEQPADVIQAAVDATIDAS